MKVIGKIDSMNFSGTHIDDMFNSDDYIIETVKGIGVLNSQRWIETFGKPLAKKVKGKWYSPYKEAKILHTSQGLMLAIKRFNASQTKQTVEFAGLSGYSEKSKLLKELLQSLLEQLETSFITRIDISIDFKDKVPNRVIKTLCKGRSPKTYKNTIYYKTKSEKSTNTKLDIKKYNKSLKDGLNYPLERLEFVFKGSYFNKVRLQDLDKIFLKMGKSIKRMSGIEVSIQSLNP